MKKMKPEEAFELINRRRRQMHVHSVIYYQMHTSIITDATFDDWAVELANTQKEYPQFKHKGYMPGLFADWTGDTGMHLPTTDAVYTLATQLLRVAEKKNHTQTPASKPKAKKERWEGDVGYVVN